ncbi:30S ribosomal protein S21 [bacterium]|nr:30S ribosomal protein S21 [bacterium]
MPNVRVREGEPFDRAFRRFTKACEKCGLMAEIRKHQRYIKPSEAKKRKSAAARRKMRKLRRLQRMFFSHS